MQLSKEKIEWFRNHPVEAAELCMNIKLPWWKRFIFNIDSKINSKLEIYIPRSHQSLNYKLINKILGVKMEDYMESNMTTISQERYDELLTAELKLMALEGAGVDNWEGYGDAMEMLDEMKKEEENEE